MKGWMSLRPASRAVYKVFVAESCCSRVPSVRIDLEFSM